MEQGENINWRVDHSEGSMSYMYFVCWMYTNLGLMRVSVALAGV